MELLPGHLVPRRPGHAGLALIKVHADSAEYWDTSLGNPAGAVIGLIKLPTAKAKGQRPDLGENQTVQLGTSTPSSGH